MISKPTLWGLLASVTAELERIDPRSPVAALARAYLIGEDLPGPIEAPVSRKKRAYLDPGRAIRVADLHAEGMSTYQIAAALGCSVTTAAKDLERQGIERDGRHFHVHPGTLRNWIIRAGEKVRPSPKTTKRHPQTIANAERAAQLYQRGLTTREIATAVGLSKPEMIYRLLAIAGVRPTRQRKLPNFDAALSTGRDL
jgi:hypothetical protein